MTTEIKVNSKFIALVKFVKKELPVALELEENNTTHVYFHRCGNEWVVVERSAYAVCQRYHIKDRLIFINNSETGLFTVLLMVSESMMMQMPLNVKISLFAYCKWKNKLSDDMKK